ncbi:MAG: glycosyltransferase family 2 protein [Verrucomicrobia bacterium]|nr:glycosyltransferase family 2 protein [Verrucomicrobiota bacterium]
MKISVYITSYNQCDFLREAVDSVLAQTLRPHEIIIVDDASPDGSPELIRDYARRHPGLIKPIFHATNCGVARTRIDALHAATGDYVTYVDGDDRMLPEKLEREAAALAEHPAADLAYSNHYNMLPDGRRTDTWIREGDEPPPEGDVFAPTFARNFPRRDIFRMELVRLDTLRRAGFHDPALPVFEDFDLRIRLTKIARACYVNAPLFEIRRQGTGLSTLRPDLKMVLLRDLYAKNRALLADCDPGLRRHVRRRYWQWMATFARQAGHAALHDSARSFPRRRLAAAMHFAFVGRHAPDVLTLGDCYCLFLPARTAEHLI